MAIKPRPGDHLVTLRGVYSHHGLYVGNGRVIHYSGFADGKRNRGRVEEVTLEEFTQGKGYKIKEHPVRRYSRQESVARARSRLGEDAYDLFANNCEHFVNWCIEGDHRSSQVDTGMAVASAAKTGAAGMVARTAVASAGSVAGLSGSGIMSGLATLGRAATLGAGGVAVGIGALGAIQGIAAASLLNNTVLKDDESLPEEERKARKVGRVATHVGAAAGAAGSVAAVSAMGTTAGLSAAGITSGLAAIGSTVGGGMAAGVAITAAAPVAAAAAVGYGLYKAVKWFSS